MAHGHQHKSIATFVAAIIDKQTGCQAALARTQGNQEAAGKRVSRLLHNERLRPQDCATWLCRRALAQLPRTGKVRVTIDWTSEGDQPLLVVSLVVGRRALPIVWRAYAPAARKGRMTRYELAVSQRACPLIFQYVAPCRIRRTADRGFADAKLCARRDALAMRFLIRVKGSTKVEQARQGIKLNKLRFVGNARRRHLGRIRYCASAPHLVWVTMSRARDKKGQWGIWYLVSNRPLRAQQAATA